MEQVTELLWYASWDASGVQYVCVILVTTVLNKYLGLGGKDVNTLFLFAQEAEPRRCRTLPGRDQNVSFITGKCSAGSHVLGL